MQYSGSAGVAKPARWEAACPERHLRRDRRRGRRGGDLGQQGPHHGREDGRDRQLRADATNRTATVTARVQVTDGKVTLDAAGGTNTILDYVTIVPVTGVLGAGATLARINFAPTGVSDAAPLRQRLRHGLRRRSRLRLDQPDEHDAALDRRQQPRPRRGEPRRPAPRHLHVHAVRRHGRREPAGPLAVRGPERHLRRDRLGGRRQLRHRLDPPGQRQRRGRHQQLRPDDDSTLFKVGQRSGSPSPTAS